MRISLLILVCLGGAGFFLRATQPDLWNQFISVLESKSPVQQILVEKPATVTDQFPKEVSRMPELITPETRTFVNPDHVVEAPIVASPVVQPKKIFIPPSPLPAQANWTWTTNDGKRIYNDVIVSKVEADCVTILDEDGGARIDISTLPDDIQKQLNYDSTLAKEAALTRQQDDRASSGQLAAERQEAQTIAQSQQSAVEANDRSILQADAIQKAKEQRIAKAAQAQSDLNFIQGDYDVASKHITIDPKTGQIYGSNYWVSKYTTDSQNMSNLRQTISSSTGN